MPGSTVSSLLSNMSLASTTATTTAQSTWDEVFSFLKTFFSEFKQVPQGVILFGVIVLLLAVSIAVFVMRRKRKRRRRLRMRHRTSSDDTADHETENIYQVTHFSNPGFTDESVSRENVGDGGTSEVENIMDERKTGKTLQKQKGKSKTLESTLRSNQVKEGTEMKIQGKSQTLDLKSRTSKDGRNMRAKEKVVREGQYSTFYAPLSNQTPNQTSAVKNDEDAHNSLKSRPLSVTMVGTMTTESTLVKVTYGEVAKTNYARAISDSTSSACASSKPLDENIVMVTFKGKGCSPSREEVVDKIEAEYESVGDELLSNLEFTGHTNKDNEECNYEVVLPTAPKARHNLKRPEDKCVYQNEIQKEKSEETIAGKVEEERGYEVLPLVTRNDEQLYENMNRVGEDSTSARLNGVDENQNKDSFVVNTSESNRKVIGKIAMISGNKVPDVKEEDNWLTRDDDSDSAYEVVPLANNALTKQVSKNASGLGQNDKNYSKERVGAVQMTDEGDYEILPREGENVNQSSDMRSGKESYLEPTVVLASRRDEPEDHYDYADVSDMLSITLRRLQFRCKSKNLETSKRECKEEISIPSMGKADTRFARSPAGDREQRNEVRSEGIRGTPRELRKGRNLSDSIPIEPEYANMGIKVAALEGIRGTPWGIRRDRKLSDSIPMEPEYANMEIKVIRRSRSENEVEAKDFKD